MSEVSEAWYVKTIEIELSSIKWTQKKSLRIKQISISVCMDLTCLFDFFEAVNNKILSSLVNSGLELPKVIEHYWGQQLCAAASAITAGVSSLGGPGGP